MALFCHKHRSKMYAGSVPVSVDPVRDNQINDVNDVNDVPCGSRPPPPTQFTFKRETSNSVTLYSKKFTLELQYKIYLRSCQRC